MELKKLKGRNFIKFGRKEEKGRKLFLYLQRYGDNDLFTQSCHPEHREGSGELLSGCIQILHYVQNDIMKVDIKIGGGYEYVRCNFYNRNSSGRRISRMAIYQARQEMAC